MKKPRDVIPPDGALHAQAQAERMPFTVPNSGLEPHPDLPDHRAPALGETFDLAHHFGRWRARGFRTAFGEQFPDFRALNRRCECVSTASTVAGGMPAGPQNQRYPHMPMS